MLFSELVQETKNIIQDSSFDALVPGYVNEAFLQASGKINIPDLKRIVSIKTAPRQMYVNLTGLANGFNGRLSKINDTTIKRCSQLEVMLGIIQRDGREITEQGPIEYVALEGNLLWYFPVPVTPQTVLAVVHSSPTIMEATDDYPLEFPDICHRNIGVHGAAFLAFQAIEDGIEGAKVNTTHHYTMYEKGIQQLQEWVGRHRVHQVTSILNDGIKATVDYDSTFTRWSNAR